MSIFLIAWFIHAMGWLIAYGAGSALITTRPAPPIRAIFAYSLLSVTFQYVLKWYLTL